MRHIRKNVKAISPIIATLMLMLLAVASGIIVYAYVTGWIGGATQTAGAPKGQLQIDSITASTSQISIYVRNLGGVSVELDKVYVEGESKSFSCDPSDKVLSVGQVAHITVSGLDLESGQFYRVEVVCKDGTKISQSVKAQ